MASELSDYLANAILAWIKSTAFPSDPAAVYVSLHNAAPGGTGTTGEITTTIRVAGRVAATFGTTTARVILNSADVDFGAAAAGATVTHFGLWDAASSGNYLGGDALQTPRTITTGDPVAFLIGDLGVSFA